MGMSSGRENMPRKAYERRIAVHRKWKIALGISVYAMAMCVLIGAVRYRDEARDIQRVWHHEAAAGADTELGLSEIPGDYMISEGFASHLPLVILDTGGVEIPNYKLYDPETDSFLVPEGIDPYVDMRLSIIDNDNHVNTLADAPAVVSEGRIKVRGNLSSGPRFPKRQYTLKLETLDGEKNPLGLMGMTAADTWILNGTQLDKSYMRNYLAMNTGGELDPYTPDMRYCEAVLKNGGTYEYMGLYILYEKIEQGPGRVEIPDVDTPPALSDRSYLVLRDRLSQSAYNLSVHATQFQRPENWISLEYPSARKITPEYWEYICTDIQEIEAVLYSGEYKQFIRYRELLDVDAFVDYWIINEFFTNYDSGWNSTYLYKQPDGTVAIGPFWDFDGGLDNFRDGLLMMETTVMQETPWFDCLFTDDWFVERVIARYRQLREGVLSEEVLAQKAAAVSAFIHKPVQRDRSRWSALYNGEQYRLKEEETGLLIDRNVTSWEEETQRILDVMRFHGAYLDAHITDLYRFVSTDNRQLTNTAVGVLFILVFFVSVVLVQRVHRGI